MKNNALRTDGRTQGDTDGHTEIRRDTWRYDGHMEIRRTQGDTDGHTEIRTYGDLDILTQMTLKHDHQPHFLLGNYTLSHEIF